MTERYDPVATEKKWQQRWDESGIYRFHPQPERRKHYALTMLPYPSGNLHIGHWYAYSPSLTALGSWSSALRNHHPPPFRQFQQPIRQTN